MSRVNILVQFNVHSLSDDYYLVGTSDISSFTHKMGSGKELLERGGATLSTFSEGWESGGKPVKTIVPLGENYGDFKIRAYAQNAIGIRSPYIEVSQLINAPDISGTFRFKSASVRRLLQAKPSAYTREAQAATIANNVYKYETEFVGKEFYLDWSLYAPYGISGNAKGEVSEDNPFFSHFKIEFFSDESFGTKLSLGAGFPFSAEDLEKYYQFNIALSKGDIENLFDSSNNHVDRKVFIKITGYDAYYSSSKQADKDKHTFEAQISVENYKSELSGCYAELYGNKMEISYLNEDPDFNGGSVNILQFREYNGVDQGKSYGKEYTDSLGSAEKIEQKWSDGDVASNKNTYKYVLQLSDGYGLCGYYALGEFGLVSSGSTPVRYDALDAAKTLAFQWESSIKIRDVRIVENGHDFDISWSAEDSRGHVLDIQKEGDERARFSIHEENVGFIKGFTAQFNCPADYLTANRVFPVRDVFSLTSSILEDGSPVDDSGPKSTIPQADVDHAKNNLSVQSSTSFKLTKEDNAKLYRSWFNSNNLLDRSSVAGGDPFRKLYYQKVGEDISEYQGAEWKVDAQRKIDVTISLVNDLGEVVAAKNAIGYNEPPSLAVFDRKYVSCKSGEIEFVVPANEKINSVRVYRRPLIKPDMSVAGEEELYISRSAFDVEKGYNESNALFIDYNNKPNSFFVRDSTGATLTSPAPASRTQDVMFYNAGIVGGCNKAGHDNQAACEADSGVWTPHHEEWGYEWGYFANFIDGAGNSINSPKVNGSELNQGETVTFVDIPPMLRAGEFKPTPYDYMLVPYDSFGSGEAWFVGEQVIQTPYILSQDEDGAVRTIDLDAPMPPTGLDVKGSAKNFFLEWESSESSDVSHYNLIYINDSRSETDRLGSGTKITSGSHNINFNGTGYSHSSSEFHHQHLDFERNNAPVPLWSPQGYAAGEYVKWRPNGASHQSYRLYLSSVATDSGDQPGGTNNKWIPQDNVQVWENNQIVYSNQIEQRKREEHSTSYKLIFFDKDKVYDEGQIVFHEGECYRRNSDATVAEDWTSSNWSIVPGVTLREIKVPAFETSLTLVAEVHDKGYFFLEAVDMVGNRSKLSHSPMADNESSSITLGKFKIADMGNFEQDLSEEFPNAVMLKPSNPFTVNATNLTWDSHYLYSGGKGYFIKSGTVLLRDSRWAQGAGEISYIYWDREYGYDPNWAATSNKPWRRKDDPSDTIDQATYNASLEQEEYEIDGPFKRTELLPSPQDIRDNPLDVGDATSGLTGKDADSPYEAVSYYSFCTGSPASNMYNRLEKVGGEYKRISSFDLDDIISVINAADADVGAGKDIDYIHGRASLDEFGEFGLHIPMSERLKTAGPGDSPLQKDGNFQIARVDEVDGTYSVKTNFEVFNVATIGLANISQGSITNALISDLTADKILTGEIGSHIITLGNSILPEEGSEDGQLKLRVGQQNVSGLPRPPVYGGDNYQHGAICSKGFGHKTMGQPGFFISGDGQFGFQTTNGGLYLRDDGAGNPAELVLRGTLVQDSSDPFVKMEMSSSSQYITFDEHAPNHYYYNDGGYKTYGTKSSMQYPTDGKITINYSIQNARHIDGNPYGSSELEVTLLADGQDQVNATEFSKVFPTPPNAWGLTDAADLNRGGSFVLNFEGGSGNLDHEGKPLVLFTGAPIATDTNPNSDQDDIAEALNALDLLEDGDIAPDAHALIPIADSYTVRMRILARIDDFLDTVPDSISPYDNSKTDYVEGDKVSYLGRAWKKAGTGQGTPGSDPAKWVDITAKTYLKGDLVKHDDKIWRALKVVDDSTTPNLSDGKWDYADAETSSEIVLEEKSITITRKDQPANLASFALVPQTETVIKNGDSAATLIVHPVLKYGTETFDLSSYDPNLADWIQSMRSQLAIYKKLPDGTFDKVDEAVSQSNDEFKISAGANDIKDGKAEYFLVDRPQTQAYSQAETDLSSFKVIDKVELLDITDGASVVGIDIDSNQFLTRNLLGKADGYKLDDLAQTDCGFTVNLSLPTGDGGNSKLFSETFKLRIDTVDSGDYVTEGKISILDDSDTVLCTSAGPQALFTVSDTTEVGRGRLQFSVDSALHVSEITISVQFIETLNKSYFTTSLTKDNWDSTYSSIPRLQGSETVYINTNIPSYDAFRLTLLKPFIDFYTNNIEDARRAHLDRPENIVPLQMFLGSDNVSDEVNDSEFEIIPSYGYVVDSEFLNDTGTSAGGCWPQAQRSLARKKINDLRDMLRGQNGYFGTVNGNWGFLHPSGWGTADSPSGAVAIGLEGAVDGQVGVWPAGVGLFDPLDDTNVNLIYGAYRPGEDPSVDQTGRDFWKGSGSKVIDMIDPFNAEAERGNAWGIRFGPYLDTSTSGSEGKDYLYYIPVDQKHVGAEGRGDGKVQIKVTYDRPGQPLSRFEADNSAAKVVTKTFTDVESLRIIRVTDSTAPSTISFDNQNTNLPISSDGEWEINVPKTAVETEITARLGKDEACVAPDEIKFGNYEDYVYGTSLLSFYNNPSSEWDYQDGLNVVHPSSKSIWEFGRSHYHWFAHDGSTPWGGIPELTFRKRFDSEGVMYWHLWYDAKEISGNLPAFSSHDGWVDDETQFPLGLGPGSGVNYVNAKIPGYLDGSAPAKFSWGTSGEFDIGDFNLKSENGFYKIYSPGPGNGEKGGYDLACLKADSTVVGGIDLPSGFDNGMVVAESHQGDWANLSPSDSLTTELEVEVDASSKTARYSHWVHNGSGDVAAAFQVGDKVLDSNGAYFKRGVRDSFGVALSFQFYRKGNHFKPEGSLVKGARAFSVNRSGHMGATPTVRGPWSASTFYYGDENRRDVVHYDNKWWIAHENATAYVRNLGSSDDTSDGFSSGNQHGNRAEAYPSADNPAWEVFGAHYQAVATNFLLADDVFIKRGIVSGATDDGNQSFFASQIDKRYWGADGTTPHAKYYDRSAADSRFILTINSSMGLAFQDPMLDANNDALAHVSAVDVYNSSSSSWTLTALDEAVTHKLPFTSIPGFYLGYYNADRIPSAISGSLSRTVGNDQIPVLELRSPLGNFFRWDGLRLEMYGSVINGSINDPKIDVKIGAGGAAECTFKEDVYSGQIFVGGGFGNFVPDSKAGLGSAVVGGGHNRVFNKFSFIGGGYGNNISSQFSFIGSGFGNVIGSSQLEWQDGGTKKTNSEYLALTYAEKQDYTPRYVYSNAEARASFDVDKHYLELQNGEHIGNSFNAIVTGQGNKILRSKYSFVGSGFSNSIDNVSYSSILNGQQNSITCHKDYEGSVVAAATPPSQTSGGPTGDQQGIDPDMAESLLIEYIGDGPWDGLSIFQNGSRVGVCSDYAVFVLNGAKIADVLDNAPSSGDPVRDYSSAYAIRKISGDGSTDAGKVERGSLLLVSEKHLNEVIKINELRADASKSLSYYLRDDRTNSAGLPLTINDIFGEWVSIYPNSGPFVWHWGYKAWSALRLGESNRIECCTLDKIVTAINDGKTEVSGSFNAFIANHAITVSLQYQPANGGSYTLKSNAPLTYESPSEDLDVNILAHIDVASGHAGEQQEYERFGYNTIGGGRMNLINRSSNSVLIGSSNSTILNLRNAVVGGLGNKAIGLAADKPSDLTRGLTMFGAGNLYSAHGASPAHIGDGDSLSVSIIGSDNVSSRCSKLVILGSNNEIKGNGAIMSVSGNGVDPNYHNIQGREVNILGTNNVINAPGATAKNVAIFGSNFVLTSQDQLINAYYIGNPYPAGSGTTDVKMLSRLFVAADGGAYFTGDVITFALSDQKYKKNVSALENPLDRISKIRGVSFEWKDNQQIYSGKDVGVIAQEIEDVLPEVVEDRVTGKAVKYEKITPLLIEGIKAQQKTIESLTSRISELESIVNKLK